MGKQIPFALLYIEYDVGRVACDLPFYIFFSISGSNTMQARSLFIYFKGGSCSYERENVIPLIDLED